MRKLFILTLACLLFPVAAQAAKTDNAIIRAHFPAYKENILDRHEIFYAMKEKEQMEQVNWFMARSMLGRSEVWTVDKGYRMLDNIVEMRQPETHKKLIAEDLERLSFLVLTPPKNNKMVCEQSKPREGTIRRDGNDNITGINVWVSCEIHGPEGTTGCTNDAKFSFTADPALKQIYFATAYDIKINCAG